MPRMCSFCGSSLKYDGYVHTCDCGYIETDDMSYEEVCNHVMQSDALSEEMPF